MRGETCREIWLDIEALDWLLAYAAYEVHFQGVECEIEDGDTYDKKPNCPTESDLHTARDFQAKSWIAEFVEGPMKTQRRCITPFRLDAEFWQNLQRMSGINEDQPYDVSTLGDNQVSKVALRLCVKIAVCEGAQFEKDSGMGQRFSLAVRRYVTRRLSWLSSIGLRCRSRGQHRCSHRCG